MIVVSAANVQDEIFVRAGFSGHNVCALCSPEVVVTAKEREDMLSDEQHRPAQERHVPLRAHRKIAYGLPVATITLNGAKIAATGMAVAQFICG